MKHILVYSYQLHHDKGSEYGLAWDHIMNMSRSFRLTVLYGSSAGFHEMGNTSEIDEYLADHSFVNIKFIPVKPGFRYHLMGYSPIETWIFYKQYRKYQEDVLKVAEKIYDEDPFALVHYLGPIGYREPGVLWKLPCPYLWGPVGGIAPADMNMLGSLQSLEEKMYFILKHICNKIQIHSSNVREAFKHSDLVLACSLKTKEILIHKYHPSEEKVIYKTQNCIKTPHPLYLQKFKQDKIHILWVGNLESRKLLPLALESLAATKHRNKFVMHIVGDGENEKKYRILSKQLDLDECVVWHGRLIRDDVFNLMNTSHLLFLTSMYDVNPTVVWEAMSMCVPVLSTASKGLEDFLDEKNSFLTDNASGKHVLEGFVRVLNEISDNPDILYEKALYLSGSRNSHTWDKRAAFFSEVYEKLTGPDNGSSVFLQK